MPLGASGRYAVTKVDLVIRLVDGYAMMKQIVKSKGKNKLVAQMIWRIFAKMAAMTFELVTDIAMIFSTGMYVTLTVGTVAKQIRLESTDSFAKIAFA